MALAGAMFCISGTLSKGRKDIEADIAKHGGSSSGSVTGKVTHLLCAPSEYDGKTSKVIMAQGKGIKIVREDFLWDAIKARKMPDVSGYCFGAGGKSKAVSPPAGAPPAKRAKAAKTGKKAGAAVVNPKSGLEDTAVVYAEDDLIFCAEMIEQDVSKNMDKFYDMQVLYVEDDDEYFTFQHWGRTGSTGQKSMEGPNSSADDAQKFFAKKFKEKSGYTWGTAGTSYTPPKPGKYTVLERMKKDKVEHKWEYHVETPVDGKRPGWYPYDADSLANMERYSAQARANDSLQIRCVDSGSFTYKVDFKEATQTNTKTGKSRNIRRVKA